MQLVNTTTGVGNAAFGGAEIGVTNATLFSNTTGSYNTAMGTASLSSNTTANYNTGVGFQAGFTNQTGIVITLP
jgi:trimeric autotransporter adhesin